MPISSVIGAVGSIAGGLLGSKGADKAAKQQAAAQQASIDEQRRQFDIIQKNQQPWMQAGQGALNQLSRLYGIGVQGENPGPGQPDYSAFYNSPDYQYALQQGEQGLNRQASASGLLGSGNTLAAALRLNQGMATQNYGNYVNQLQGLAGIGQNATQQTNQAAFNTGQGVSDSLVGQGAARASGVAGQYNGYADAINGASNALGQWWNNRNGTVKTSIGTGPL